MARASFIDEVIAGFGRGLGLPDLSLDQDGRRTLVIGRGELTLSYVSEPTDLLWLHVHIADVAADDRAALVYLLQAGHQLWIANLMTIGLDDAVGRAYGCSPIPAVNLDASRLKGLAIMMLKVAAELGSRIQARDFGLPETTPQPSTQGGPSSGPPGMLRV